MWFHTLYPMLLHTEYSTGTSINYYAKCRVRTRYHALVPSDNLIGVFDMLKPYAK